MRTVVFCVAFCLLQLPASADPLPGSCIAANYTTCCEGNPTNCPGQPPTCYCDTSCYEFDDCCNDLNQICPPKLPPPPKPLLLPPTHTTLHSTTIQWIRTPTNSSTNETYMYTVKYYTNGTNPITINATDFLLGTGELFSILLRGLDPATTYIYSVSIFDMVGSSTTSKESIFTTMEYPVVRHVQTRVLNSTAVSISWSALHLPPGVTVSRYTVHYRSSGSTEETQIFSGSETCGEIGGLTPHTRYSFHVRGTIVDVDGSVSKGNSPGNGSTIFMPDSAPFQLRGGPLQNCVDWRADDERELLVFFRSVIVRAITSQCGCAYQDSLLTKDIILCEAGSPPWATFRATLMSTETCTAGRLLQCLQDWVSHQSDIQGTPDASTTIDIDRSCPVRVRLSSAPLCSARAVSGQTSANCTETCIGIPVFVSTLVAVLLLVTAVTMVVIVVALLVNSRRHKKVPSEHCTGESPGRQGAVPNLYYEPTQPSDNNHSTHVTTH